jgi:hypothetical protein
VDSFLGRNVDGHEAGMPDGLFSYQKSQFGYIFEGLRIENAGIICDHLEYFWIIWYILWPFGIVCGHLVYISRFGMFVPRKIWQPCHGEGKKCLGERERRRHEPKLCMVFIPG